MRHRKANAHLAARLFLAAFCVALAAGSLPPGYTQAPEKRKLNVRTYNRMPVMVKEIRNLQKEENWFRDLEIEVKNVSRYPIYFIALGLEFPNVPPISAPEMRADGSMPTKVTTGFSLTYGDSRLSDIKVLAGPDDVPIKPGESHVFTIPAARVQGIEWMNKFMNLPPDAWQQIELAFDLISFGNGTGFMGDSRVLY